MKLFKKLAAAVLVAALALMMVGCGSKTGLAQQVKNAVSDDAVMRNEQATNSKDLDALAAKLLTEYNNEIAALDEDEDWPDLQELLDDETFLQKFGIDPEKDAYKVSLVYVPSYISNTMNQFKPFSLADQLRRDADLAIGDPHIGRKFEFGLAIGTLDGENWVLMLMK
jgi:hypothetical protein